MSKLFLRKKSFIDILLLELYTIFFFLFLLKIKKKKSVREIKAIFNTFFFPTINLFMVFKRITVHLFMNRVPGQGLCQPTAGWMAPALVRWSKERYWTATIKHSICL